jgi:hypothetical protein
MWTALLVTVIVMSAAPTGSVNGASPLQDGDAAYMVSECRGVDRAQVRSEIEAAALAVIETGAEVDLDALVLRKWNELEVDATIRAEVAAAVESLKLEEAYLDRFLSGWSAERAEEYAGVIAERAFGSQAFDDKMMQLSNAIGDEVALLVNAELARAASAAFLCLKDYVGAAYSDTLFQAFEQSVQRSVEAAGVQVDASAIGTSALDVHALGLVGAGIIVVAEVGRRVSLKIGEKVAGRIAGKVAGRVAGRAGSSLLPVVGWVVGIGLVLWDLYEGTQGALPQIEEALTGPDVTDRIRGDVVDAVRSGMPEESAIAALETAVTMLEEWDQFCRRYEDVCSMAEENESFRTLLGTVALTDLEHLARVQEVVLDDLGRRELDRALETGEFDRLLSLPPSALAVLTTTQSLSMTMAWAEVAGEQLDAVVALGLAGGTEPELWTEAELASLSAVGDSAVVGELLRLSDGMRKMVLSLPADTVRGLAAALDGDGWRQYEVALRLPEVRQTTAAVFAQAVSDGSVALTDLFAVATPSPAATRAVASTAPSGASAVPAVTPMEEAGVQWATETPHALSATGTEDGRSTALVMGIGLVTLAIVTAGVWVGLSRRRHP